MRIEEAMSSAGAPRSRLGNSSRLSRACGALVLAAVACGKDPPRRNPVPDSSVSAANSAATSPAFVPRAETGPLAPAYRAVRAWNDALDRHDLEKLQKIYAGEVLFYGHRRTKAEVIAAKRAEFEQRPKFGHQIIGNIELDRVFDDLVVARFVKESGPPDDFEVIDARLELRGAELLVSEESDQRSLAQQNAIPEGCDEKAAQVVRTVPAVERAREEATRLLSRGEDRRLGGFGPEPDGAGGFEVVEGIYIEGTLQTFVAYEVDREGQLRVRVKGNEVEPSRAGLRAVELACRH